jgi:hypothetical protein
MPDVVDRLLLVLGEHMRRPQQDDAGRHANGLIAQTN